MADLGVDGDLPGELVGLAEAVKEEADGIVPVCMEMVRAGVFCSGNLAQARKSPSSSRARVNSLAVSTLHSPLQRRALVLKPHAAE